MKFKSLITSLSLCSTAFAAVPLHLSPVEFEKPQFKIESIDASKALVIAIVDTGADLSHPAFKDFLWFNPGETGLDSHGRDKSSNGIDDDANGFIDDVHGWNFIGNSSSLKDQHGHGTHIAGLIAEQIPQGLNVKFMILKYFDSEASDAKNLEASNRSLEYARKMGAKVVNYSGGGDLPNLEERKIFNRLSQSGMMVVAAAGNESRSNDFQGFYPASYGFDNIISVASIDKDGKILDSSNHGSNSVDIGALGKDVRSSLPGQRYGKLTGTSQATAIVSGVLSSLWVTHPYITDANELKNRLFATATFNPNLNGKVRNPSVPDVSRAIHMKDQNELSKNLKLVQSRISEVFDDPTEIHGTVEREISSQSADVNNLN